MVRRLPQEVVVYDLERHQAHCLNQTAAVVFEHCDGQTTATGIAKALSAKLGTPADEAVVQLSLQKLADAHLLESKAGASQVSRRELVRRLGAASAVLLPIVVSLAVPTPAQAAATCVPDCMVPDPATNEAALCGPPSCINTCQSGACLP